MKHSERDGVNLHDGAFPIHEARHFAMSRMSRRPSRFAGTAAPAVYCQRQDVRPLAIDGPAAACSIKRRYANCDAGRGGCVTHAPTCRPVFFEFLDRRHRPYQELEVGFDRGPVLRALSVMTTSKKPRPDT